MVSWFVPSISTHEIMLSLMLSEMLVILRAKGGSKEGDGGGDGTVFLYVKPGSFLSSSRRGWPAAWDPPAGPPCM
jgi:hypothetical protein